MKVYYTNPLDEVIEFSATSKYKLLNVDDLGGNDVISQSVSSPYQDGTTSVGESYFKSKIMIVSFTLISSTLNADMRSLQKIINPKLGIGKLTVSLGTNTYVLEKVKVRTMADRDGRGDGLTFQVSKIIFEVFDPLYADISFTEQFAVNSVNLLEFDLDITDDFEFGQDYASGYVVQNLGDVACPVTIEITGALTAPLEVENLTTGDKIKVILDLTADEELIITTEIDNINVIKKTISTGVEVVAFQYIDVAETTFFYLPVGVSNIAITSTEGEVQGALFKFKNRYVGI